MNIIRSCSNAARGVCSIEDVMGSPHFQESEYEKGAYALLFNRCQCAKEALDKCKPLFASCLSGVPSSMSLLSIDFSHDSDHDLEESELESDDDDFDDTM